MAFRVDVEYKVKEICEKNNFIEDRTDALALQMRVTQELYNAWGTKPNGIGSYSFEDWCQRHVKIMNGALAGSIYPKTAPKGILERVRMDNLLIMTKEKMQAEPPQKLGYDGGWNYYDDNLGKENSWFDFHIQDNFIDRVDTGLIHELTHQLGIIDMYCIVIGAHWNHVLDEEGDPIMIGFRTKFPGMMGGGGPTVDFDGTVQLTLLFAPDADGNVAVGEKGTFVAYSEETAGALNSQKGVRRGHYGKYLYDIPKQSFIKVLDKKGKPVEGAWITVYQQSPYPCPQSIPDQPLYGGDTDKDGIYGLGSLPFGNINVVGLNGILMFAISTRGQTEYHFLDVCLFNVAKWRGFSDKWVAVIQTGISSDGAPKPPENLRYGMLKPNTKPVLRWEPSSSPGIASYNIYRQRTYGNDGPSGLSVTFDTPFVKVASVPATQTSCEVEPINGGAGCNDTPWFTVTAVDDKGLESAYAKNKELMHWGPIGNATVERENIKTVKITLSAGASSIQAYNVFIIKPSTRLTFKVKAESDRASIIRLNIAAIGDVDLALTTLFPEGTNLADGQWHDANVELRPIIDKIAAEKKATPAQARTTWNEDWVVMSCQFGDWSGKADKKAVFYFEDFKVLTAN